MIRTSLGRAGLLVALSLVSVGCAGNDWQKIQVSSGYQAPKEMKVSIVCDAKTENVEGAVSALQQALASELAARGIKAEFVTTPDPSSSQVSVVEWDQGVRALRWIGFGMGEGHIIVMVKTLAGDGQPGVDGQTRGWVKGGFFGGSSYDAATAAGRAIGKAIATGAKS